MSESDFVDVIWDSQRALAELDLVQVEMTIEEVRQAERVFCIGNGGGYAHAMHFASDLRKIAHKQAFSFDNLTELTARVNDDGWAQAWFDWRGAFGRGDNDLMFLFSVGGGLDGLSGNLPAAAYGIVGENGAAYDRIVIPSTSTPVIEGCQSVVAHHIVEQLCA